MADKKKQEYREELVLSKTKKIVFSHYTVKGKTFGSIREFYLSGDEWKPGKSGMVLAPEHINAFYKQLKPLFLSLVEEE